MVNFSEIYNPKLVASLGFGFWRYLYSPHQYRVGGQTLLAVFSSRPNSTPTVQYNASYIFNELQKIDNLRNRIAHHEPICFQAGQAVIDTTNVRQLYNLILQLFQWMSIDESALLYSLDHILTFVYTQLPLQLFFFIYHRSHTSYRLDYAAI